MRRALSFFSNMQTLSVLGPSCLQLDPQHYDYLLSRSYRSYEPFRVGLRILVSSSQKDSCQRIRSLRIEDVCRTQDVPSIRINELRGLLHSAFNQVETRSSEPTFSECLALITFTDDYLQPGLIKHNKPLFISGYLNGFPIRRFMIDGDRL